MLGKLLQQLREKAGLTQRDLARKIGRRQAYVWKVETGAQHIDVATLLDWTDAVGGDVLELLGEVRRSRSA